jgi:hypothetical protein
LVRIAAIGRELHKPPLLISTTFREARNTRPKAAIEAQQRAGLRLYLRNRDDPLIAHARVRAAARASKSRRCKPREQHEAEMDSLDGLNLSYFATLLERETGATRRRLMLAPFLAALPLALSGTAALASPINPSQTQVTLPDAINWSGWINGFPPHSGEMATLYGDLNKPGPYLVLMKWHPGYMSAPHTYATDRISLVLSGTWWVNSGADFDPNSTVPVRAGSFVQRVARTPHYDGVKNDASEPAVIGLFGIAPVQFELVDPSKPAWRRL